MIQNVDLITQDHVCGDTTWRVTYRVPPDKSADQTKAWSWNVERVEEALRQLSIGVRDGKAAGNPVLYVSNGLAHIVDVRTVTMQAHGSWSVAVSREEA